MRAVSGEDVLNELPVLTRSDLQRQGARLWSRQGDSSTWRLVRTSGTTGEPVSVLVDEDTRSAEAMVLAGHIDRCLDTDTWRQRTLFHVTLHAGASTVTSAPSGWIPRAVKWNLIRAWQADDDSFVESLRHLSGHIVTTMPSAAELISSRILAAGAGGSTVPLLVVLSGETVWDRQRETVEAAFDSRVTTLYTLAEVGIVGSECEAGGYHVEDQVAVVEILDDLGRPTPMGAEGELVVTSLVNRAMPLIRYRTGDRGRWENAPCTCERASTRLFLAHGRRPVSLVAESGATVNVVRFSKLIAGLDVHRINIRGLGRGDVRVEYEAEGLLDRSSHLLLESALRSALGPTASIVICRSSPTESDVHEGEHGASPIHAEPAGPSAHEVAAWLRSALSNSPRVNEVEAAVITGSYLDAEATTRFSDIDIVILLKETADGAAWQTMVPLAAQLRRELPQLRVNVDSLAAVRTLAPLLAARLLQEQLPLIGTLTTDNLPWPSIASVRAHGRYWTQESHALLWTSLTDPSIDRKDVLLTAWLAAKQSVGALRYHYLARGARVTASRDVLAMALEDKQHSGPWLEHVVEAFDVAREHRPPPDPASSPSKRYITASLSCLGFVRDGL
jgi:phenylacetate-coenzyme A ligase PaaK-like adenylate-forming protein/predicted nucleotidyltransferase